MTPTIPPVHAQAGADVIVVCAGNGKRAIRQNKPTAIKLTVTEINVA